MMNRIEIGGKWKFLVTQQNFEIGDDYYEHQD